MVEKYIGKRIKQYRKIKGLTQEQLAEKVEISTNYLSAVERGINLIAIDKLVDILNCLQCSADEIFADVVDVSFDIEKTQIGQMLQELPIDEQKRILEVVKTLIETAKK